MYSPYYIPGLFYTIYLLLIILRLETSLRGSYLALKPKTLYILKGLTLIIPITATISLCIGSFDNTCIAEWYLPESNESIHVCNVLLDSVLAFRLHIYEALVVMINGLNITFGIIFSVKLKKIVRVRKESNIRSRFKFEALVRKNEILTIIGCISMFTGYAMVMFTENPIYVNIDGFINCVIIGLMESRNRKYYSLLCSPCIALCVRQPFRSTDFMYNRSQVIMSVSLLSSPSSMGPASTPPAPPLISEKMESV